MKILNHWKEGRYKFDVGVNLITRQGDDMVHINPSIGVRQQPLEKSIFELTGQKPHDYLPATISSALGYLTPEKQYGVFSFAREEDIGSTAESLAESINEYALPWMRENQELRTILHHLSNNQFTFLDAARLRVPVILSMLGEDKAASDMVQKNLAEVGMAEGPIQAFCTSVFSASRRFPLPYTVVPGPSW